MIKISYDSIFDIVPKIIDAKENGRTVIVPHVCNNIGAFGAGFAAAVRKNYPIVATNYEMLGDKLKLGYTQYVEVAKDDKYDHKIIFANMIAQNKTISRDNPRPLHYGALVKCMYDVASFAKNLDSDNTPIIHAPKFGSQLAGGNFNFIENLIEDIWSNIDVTVYEYKPKNKC